MSGSDEELSPLARAYRSAGPWLNAVWQFTGSALVGVAAGYAVDWWLGVGPFGLVVGGLLGSGVGFYAFIRTTNRLLGRSGK